MTRVKRIPVTALPVLAVVVGAASALAGIYLLAGLAVALIVGGIALAGAGMVVDLG